MAPAPAHGWAGRHGTGGAICTASRGARYFVCATNTTSMVRIIPEHINESLYGRNIKSYFTFS